MPDFVGDSSLNSMLSYIAYGCAAYLLGSVPFSYLIGKARGVDVRKVGSGNVGATNVMRTVGRKWGLLAFACDFLKGFAATVIITRLGADLSAIQNTEIASVICGCAAIAGHNWPIFLKFKGGKGVATTAGALLGIAPLAMSIGLASWLMVFFATRYVSLASILAAVVAAISAWILPVYKGNGPVIPSTLTALALLVVIRHKSNIQRLVTGTENRANIRKKQEKTDD